MAAGDLGLIRQIIVDAISGDSGVDGLVAGRVYGRHLVGPDLETADYPLVIVEMAGGSRNYFAPYREMTVVIWTYSRVSSEEASDLYDLVGQAIHAQALTTSNVSASVVCREVDSGHDGWNEATRAWYKRGRYLAHSLG